MIRDAWDWMHRRFMDSAPVGSPENPEIIEPGARRAQAPQIGRARLVFKLLSSLLVVSAPAIFLIWSSLWLIDIGTRIEGAAFAWLLLILLAPITLVATVAAFVIDSFLLIGIIATLSGRRMVTMKFGGAAGGPVHRSTYARPTGPRVIREVSPD